ncbi:MAG: hypothetical protein JW951_01150 [Lentisphaerae bacterium]|nr:hypothetical protein [Lentisphaerota bacterium]
MNRLQIWFASLWAVLVAAALLLALHTNGRLIRIEWLAQYLWLLPPALLAVMMARRTGSGVARPPRLGPLLICFAGLLAFLVSSAVLDKSFYFEVWQPDRALPSPFGSGLTRFVLGAALLTPLFVRGVRRVWLVLLALLLAGQLFCLHGFLETTGARALYCDDHPSFMFRLREFADTFPRLVNYNPFWNGGAKHTSGIVSGVHGIGFLTWPWIRAHAVHDVYTPAYGILFLLVVPWAVAASVSAVGASRAAALTAGIVALGVSQEFYLWALHYGTIGAAFSQAMLVPVACLVFRVVCLGRRDRRTWFALTGALFLLVLWPPGALMGAALACSFAIHAPYWTWRRIGFLLLSAVTALLLYSPWLQSLLFHNPVLKFTVTPPDAALVEPVLRGRTAWAAGCDALCAHLRAGHPVLLFFGLGGVLAAAPRRLRLWFAPPALVLAALTAWGPVWAPHLQLHRMAIPFFWLLVPPAAVAVAHLLTADRPALAPVRAALVMLLVLTVLNTRSIYCNRGRFRYSVLDHHVARFAQWIAANVPAGGRLLFTGPTHHAYFKGHVAYLPVLSGREMMACDYYAFPPEMVKYEYPPAGFRETPEAMLRFFDLYNVTHVATVHKAWKERLASCPGLFSETARFDYVTVYRVAREPVPLQGAPGSVRATWNRMDVTLEADADTVILPYNWVDGLQVTRPAELFPGSPEAGIQLIGVRPRGARAFRVSYGSLPD